MNRLSFLCWIALLLCGCGAERPSAPRSAFPTTSVPAASQPLDEPSANLRVDETELSDYVRFPALGIRMRQPKEFDKADGFDGFGQEETNSSVLITVLPGPYAKISAGLTREFMKPRGWTFLSRQEIKVDGVPGFLVHFDQPAHGDVYRKWSLVFGDERKTTMVTATFPKELEAELSARLKTAVLSVRLDQPAGDTPEALPPFTITASPKLKRITTASRTLAYTKEGVIPVKSPTEPMFIAAPSLGKGVTGDLRQFAERRMKATAGAKRLAIKSTEPITVDGLEGYESLAEAEHDGSGAPLVVYQVMLFDDGAYILMTALVGSELRDEYLPEFKAMARSLKRKP
jgi:hypothetical protein